MAYLGVSPMIVALQTSPIDFDKSRGWLNHFPSHHRFKFDREGNVRLDARCACAFLSVSHEQRLELWEAFRDWHAAYWRPVEINREFASHFRRPNIWQRLCRGLIRKLRLFARDAEADVAELRVEAAPSSVPVRV